MMPMPWPGPKPDPAPRHRPPRGSSRVIKRMRRSRMLGWDHNSLRRRIDRVEAAMVAGLIAVFLIFAPVLGVVAGHLVSSANMQQQRAESAWRLVPATVQVSAQGDNSAWASTVRVLARWTAPDGLVRRGWIPVSPADAAAGSTRVWVTRSGSLTGPPLLHSQVQANTVMAELVTVLVLGLLLWLAGGAGRVLLDRRRLAGWSRAWRVAEPGWTRKP